MCPDFFSEENLCGSILVIATTSRTTTKSSHLDPFWVVACGRFDCSAFVLEVFSVFKKRKPRFSTPLRFYSIKLPLVLYYNYYFRELKLKQRYKEKLRNVTESLQRENENLREQLEKW